MSTLRHRIVRLAHANPELRPHLLPLVASGVVPLSKRAAGDRLTFEVDTHVSNVTGIGGGNWRIDGTCTVAAPGLPATSFRFREFDLSYSEATGWTPAASSGSHQEPIRAVLVATGLSGFAPPSAAEASLKPRLEFKPTWGGGTTVVLLMVMGSSGDEFPNQSPAHEYAARALIAELARVNVKEILVESLGLSGVRSVEGPARPTLRDVYIEKNMSRHGDNRAVLVRYKIRGVSGADLVGRFANSKITDAFRKAGIRY